MLVYTSTLLAAASTDDSDSPIVRYVIIAVAVGLSVLIFPRFFRRAAKKDVEAATDGVVDAFGVSITPHPPFPEQLSALRKLVGDTSPDPRITSYSRPVVTVDSIGLKISDKKLGTLVILPVADIVSMETRPAAIKPKIALVASRIPSVWIGARRGDVEVSIALTPLVWSSTGATAADAEAFATQLSSRLGALRG